MENIIILLNREDVYEHLFALCQNDDVFSILDYRNSMRPEDFERIIISDTKLVDELGQTPGAVIGTVRLLPNGVNTTAMFVYKDALWNKPITESGKLLFSQFMQRAKEHFRALNLLEENSGVEKSNYIAMKMGNDVFVVHGHDEATKEAVARFIERIGAKVIILHEQPNAGKTIIEKFEAYTDVGFAVVLLTPDDVGTSKLTNGKSKPRARQNVIFELGYFIGKLGRNRVCALHKEEIELPSDIDGLLYVPMDSSGAWRLTLAREIKHAGLIIDLNKV